MKLLYYLGKTQQKLTKMTPKNLEKIYDSVNGSPKGSLNTYHTYPFPDLCTLSYIPITSTFEIMVLKDISHIKNQGFRTIRVAKF